MGLIDDLKSSYAKGESPKSRFRFSDIAFFFKFVRPVWKLGALSLILAVFIGGVKAVIPMSSKVLIDFVILNTGFDGISNFLASAGLASLTPQVISFLSSIDLIIIALILVGIVYAAMQILQGYLTAKYQQELTYNLQTSLFDHVLRFPMTFFKDKQTGYLVSRVSDDVDTLQYMFSSAITQIISNGFYVIFGLALLLSLNVKLAAVMIVILPVYFFMRHFFFERIRTLSYKERETRAELSQDMQEALSGVEVIKTHATEEKEVEKVSGRLRNVIQIRLIYTILSSLSSAIMSGVQFVLLLLVVWIGIHEIRNGTMTIGDFVTFVSYILFLTGAVNSLFYTYISFQPMLASMDRLKEMFNAVQEYNRDVKTSTLLILDHVEGEVTFENVSFAYNSDEPVLKDISFSVKPGEIVALVGPSGVGKTTLVNLMLKLYKPGSGIISIDGNDLQGIDHAWLRKQVGIVSQDIFLFNDTIENNIKYGKTEASREEVIKAARDAHIHEFIIQLPKGYDTVIGERGTKLSVGQRQRISIARSFLKSTPLLILDEPTSSLDTETEKWIKESLKNLVKGKTTFIISHRLSLIDMADKILVIEDGKITQTGTHKELIIKEGLYKKMTGSEISGES